MRSCATCAHFRRDGESVQGFCRAHPPQAFIVGEAIKSAFPPVPEHFDCGDHKPAAKRKAARPV